MPEDFFLQQYKKLNARQKQAVETIDGSVMVIAGPGTGKTQVIAMRIGQILKKTDTPADGVLCLTFTNSGVEAMRKRLHEYIGPEAGRVVISTFHAFGTKVIEEFYHALGLPSAPKTLDDQETLSLVDDILNNHEWTHIRPRGNSAMYFRDLKSLVSILIRERLSPQDFLAEIEKETTRLKNDPESISSRGESKGKLKKDILTKLESFEKTKETVKFYELYQEAKREQNVLDYDDILSNLVRLVSESDEVRDSLRERYLYVLVDEHQDSSGVQNEFLKQVWGPVEKPNIFVVGDDRQLIYGFSGASLSYFEEFKETFDGTKVINLTDNYRSTQRILDLAEYLKTSELSKEKLISQTKEDHPILLVECQYPRDEVLRAGLFFREKIEKGTVPEDCALLLPKNHHVRSAIAVLRDLGLLVSASKSLNLFDTSEFYSFMNILKTVTDPFNNIALAESLLDPLSGIPVLTAHEFLHRTRTRELSLETLLKEKNELEQWGLKLKNMVEVSADKSVYEIIQLIGKEFFLAEGLDHDAYVRRVEVIRSLLHLGLSLEEKDKYVKIGSYLAFVNRLEEYGERVPLAIFAADKGVRVLTLHGSKGLEFEAVWIAHLNERSLMSGKKMGFALPERIVEHLEEKDESAARRELYVAITRAKRFCALSYARLSHKGAEERLAAIVEALPKESFEFTDGSISEKEILKDGLDRHVSSNRESVSAVSRVELRELVAENYQHKRVSVTLLNNFFECPWKWYFRSFLEVPEPLSESLKFGSLVHEGIEAVLKGEKWKVEDDRLSREAEKIVARFKKEFLPTLPEHYTSEQSLSYKDKAFPNLTITGKIDLAESEDAEHVRVTDFKTGKSRAAKEIEKFDDEDRLSSYLRQLAMYSYLIISTHKGRIEVEKSRLYFVEEKDAAKTIYETHINHEHIDALIRDIKDYDALMKNGKWTERPCEFKPYGSGQTECPYCKLAEMYK